MAKHNKKLPQEVIDHWPEVFGDVELDVIPIRYLDSVKVQFNDGKTWDIDLTEKDVKENTNEVEKSLRELFDNYEQSIEHIDFKLNTKRIKADIKRKTSAFLKKKK